MFRIVELRNSGLRIADWNRLEAGRPEPPQQSEDVLGLPGAAKPVQSHPDMA